MSALNFKTNHVYKRKSRSWEMVLWIGQLLTMIILIGGAFVVGVECGGAVSKKEG